MEKELFEALQEAHNVACPVCGSRASFEITGETTYTTISCGHPEIESLIDERSYTLIIKPNISNKKTVKFRKPDL